jgi:A/G-specific adenine glycosylase
LTENKFQAFSSLLLEWYFKEDKRTFPWRQKKNPYEILIAEIMLQRTRAEQVAPVFLSFIKKFPSPELLTKANVSELEVFFSRLGLLWRAKKVKFLAEKLCSDFNGSVPTSRNALLSLPGIGEYVSDAVLCFAFEEDRAIVDSNVCRILGRVFSIKSTGEARRNPVYREIAEKLTPRGKCREFNWALIDHANEICTPKNPKCPICPLNGICDYFNALNQRT